MVSFFWGAFPVFLAGLRLGGLQLRKKSVEPLEVLLPNAAVALQPLSSFREGLGFEAPGTPLRVAALGNQAGTLENFKVLGDGGLAHGERLGKLQHGGLAPGQASEDGAARGLGPRRGGHSQLVSSPKSLNRKLHNPAARDQTR